MGVFVIIAIAMLVKLAMMIYWVCKHIIEHENVHQGLGNVLFEAVIPALDNLVSFLPLLQRIETLFSNLDAQDFVKSSSPLSLTPKGEKIALDIQVPKLMIWAYSVLKDHIDKPESPKTAYDIQAKSMAAARQVFNLMEAAGHEDSDEYRRYTTLVKDAAFKQGATESSILSVVGIAVRDKILEDYGIPISQVDKTTPTK